MKSPLLTPSAPTLRIERRAAARHDIFALLRGLRGQPRWLWLEDERALLGWGSAAALQGQSAPEIARQLAALPAEYAHLPLFGGMQFDPSRPAAAEWRAFPAAEFILPRALYSLEGNAASLTWLSTHPHSAPPPLSPRPLENLSQAHNSQSGLRFADWEALIQRAQAAMRAGRLQKVVLSRICRLFFEQPPPAETVFQRLAAAYPRTFRFFFEPVPGHIFLGATPERLVSARQAMLYTSALAGSAPRGQTPAEDQNLAQSMLLDDPKNRREHALVVEHIVSRLKALGAHPHYPAEPRIRRLANIQHLETPIRARLNGHSLLEAAAALHPTPALGGAPRAEALNFIRQNEPHQRGWYGAPLGWLNAQGGTLAVGIRSALILGSQAWLYAGAGILPASDARSEWEETALKFRPLKEAFGVR